MDTIQSYKCPCCGAPLAFNAANQNLHCESCGTDFDLDTMKQLDEAEPCYTGVHRHGGEQQCGAGCGNLAAGRCYR